MVPLPEPPAPSGSGPLGLGRLDRFELLERIGAGGMSSVYLGRLSGPRGFEKLVALKVLHRSLSMDPEAVELFFHEARTVSRLSHPNVVQVLELGEADGVYYIVMEYLRGVSLGRLLEATVAATGRGLPPRLACHLVKGVAEALHHAHEALGPDGCPLEVVHLDVTPENVLVTESGTVKLIDFGIARSRATERRGRPALRGKLSYVAPEQVRGEVPDRRADVFSLGAVLWETLSGRRLFEGDNPLACLYRVTESPVPPLAREPGGIPPLVDRVVARALERSPEDRYRTALELQQELDRAGRSLGPGVSSHELASFVSELLPVRRATGRHRLGPALEAARHRAA